MIPTPGAGKSPVLRSGWWVQVSALVWKDLRAEIRTRESLTPMLVFGFVVITVFGFGLRATGIDLTPVFPGLMWIAVYFVGLLGLGRSFAAEKAQDTLAGLRLVPADPSFIYVGKLLAPAGRDITGAALSATLKDPGSGTALTKAGPALSIDATAPEPIPAGRILAETAFGGGIELS